MIPRPLFEEELGSVTSAAQKKNGGVYSYMPWSKQNGKKPRSITQSRYNGSAVGASKRPVTAERYHNYASKPEAMTVPAA